MEKRGGGQREMTRERREERIRRERRAEEERDREREMGKEAADAPLDPKIKLKDLRGGRGQALSK